MKNTISRRSRRPGRRMRKTTMLRTADSGILLKILRSHPPIRPCRDRPYSSGSSRRHAGSSRRIRPAQASTRTPSVFTPLTRRIPATKSALNRPQSAASYACRHTTPNRKLIVPGARRRDWYCCRTAARDYQAASNVAPPLNLHYHKRHIVTL